MKLKALIIDDEEASRLTIKNYLTKYCPNVEILGEADGVKSGVEKIESLKPDLVFLDVEMPYGNGFDLLEQVSEITFETIFVTAFSHYAVKAFNFSAAHYILKPIDIDELVEAVERVEELKKENSGYSHTNVLLENLKMEGKQLQKVVLPMIDGFEVVKVKDIIRCKANDNFTDFYLADGSRRMICRTLKFYDQVLSEFDFVRVHKSHLVNINYVKKYLKGKGGQIEMQDGSFVDVSASKKQNFLSKFSM